MKRFLEGKGWVNEIKYGNVSLDYSEIPIVITSNELPNNMMSESDWAAFRTRC